MLDARPFLLLVQRSCRAICSVEEPTHQVRQQSGNLKQTSLVESVLDEEFNENNSWLVTKFHQYIEY